MSRADDTPASEAALALLMVMPAVGRLAEDAARKAGCISVTQAQFVHALLERPLRGVELARHLCTTRAAVAEVAARLQAQGLLRSLADATDGRARLLEVTSKGRAAIERFGAVTTQALARVVACLPARRQAALRNSVRDLQRLLANAVEDFDGGRR